MFVMVQHAPVALSPAAQARQSVSISRQAGNHPGAKQHACIIVRWLERRARRACTRAAPAVRYQQRNTMQVHAPLVERENINENSGRGRVKKHATTTQTG
jgi:hypothetical protein